MSFGAVGTIGNATENTSDTSLVITTSATLEAGNIGVLMIAIDNTATTDADHSEISSVVDSAGNTWEKLLEYTNGQGAANAGVTGAIWASDVTAQLTSGGTITITLANAVSGKAAIAWEFTTTLGDFSATISNQLAGDGADPASFGLIGLSSGDELLILHAIALEAAAGTLTVDSDYTDMGQANGGGAGAAAITITGEYRIVTGITADTVDAGWSAARDHVQLLIALKEIAGGGGSSIAAIQYNRMIQGMR